MKKEIYRSGIYTITNKVNDKMYVGYATSFKSRWSKHIWAMKLNRHENNYLQSAWNKYGEENFVFEILVECEIQLLCSEEHYWCNMLLVHDRKYGYNIEPTHPHKVCKNKSPETLEKMRIANTGRRTSQETRDKISKAFKGRPSPMLGKKHKQESIDQRIATLRKNGKINHSQETKDKIGKANKNKVHTEKMFGWRFRPVLQYDLSGNLIAEYRCVRDANIAVNACNGEISSVCKVYNGTFKEGKKSNRLTCKGFVWKYKTF